MANDAIPFEEEDVITEKRIEEPPRFKVLLHNDNYTTMEFVISILCRIFNKDIREATRIMETVHTKGIGQCGIYTKEIAETKVTLVRNEARNARFPLKCTMEKC